MKSNDCDTMIVKRKSNNDMRPGDTDWANNDHYNETKSVEKKQSPKITPYPIPNQGATHPVTQMTALYYMRVLRRGQDTSRTQTPPPSNT